MTYDEEEMIAANITNSLQYLKLKKATVIGAYKALLIYSDNVTILNIRRNQPDV